MSRFMISDKKGLYLRRDASGNYIPVKKKELGDVWNQRSKASNVLINCVNKNLRNKYSVIEIEETVISPQKQKKLTIKNVETAIKPKDKTVKKLGDEVIEDNQLSSLSVNIDNFAGFVQNAEERKEILSISLSDVDKEISDINHYIEFGKFNAYQGWLAFNLLRSRLKKRRKIKDELHILTQLGECKVNSAMIEDIKTSIEKLNSRKYQPRKLNELFE